MKKKNLELTEKEIDEIFKKTFAALAMAGSLAVDGIDEKKRDLGLHAYASNLLLFGVELIIKLGCEPEDFFELVEDYYNAVVLKINLHEAKESGLH